MNRHLTVSPLSEHSKFLKQQINHSSDIETNEFCGARAALDLQKTCLGSRSDISMKNPYLIIHLHLTNEEAILSLQSTVESLHKRGYRPLMADAPLKENLAAGLVQITEWEGKKPLIDIMCGSGTLLIEAISQRLRIPNITKKNYLFENWIDFKKDILHQKN